MNSVKTVDKAVETYQRVVESFKHGFAQRSKLGDADFIDNTGVSVLRQTKANCPMRPIVSACGTATYQLAKFLTKILQKYTGITPMFVKYSKCFSEYLRSVHIGKDEELVSFDVSALITSAPVPAALDIIN